MTLAASRAQAPSRNHWAVRVNNPSHHDSSTNSTGSAKRTSLSPSRLSWRGSLFRQRVLFYFVTKNKLVYLHGCLAVSVCKVEIKFATKVS